MLLNRNLDITFNEATTEIIARWVCKQNSIPSEDSAYRLERALFALAFQEKLGLELGDVSPAYLAGQHLDVIYQMFCDWLTGQRSSTHL